MLVIAVNLFNHVIRESAAKPAPAPTESILMIPQPVPVATVEAELQEPQEPQEDVRELFKVRATAYTKDDPGMDGRGITSSGTRVKPITKPDPDTGLSTIAAHPSFLKPGTIVVIPALSNYPNKGRFIVEDTGGAIYDNRVDVCFASRSKALEFGVQMLDAYVEGYIDGEDRENHSDS